MEFPFDLSVILPDEITIVTNSLIAFRRNHAESAESLQRKLCKVIDAMGVASAHAQGLNGAITSTMKLRGSDHHLYICRGTNEGTTNAAIGILRVGVKKLFVVDIHGQQLEVHPLCVLDFYVSENKQRSGYGRKLFDYMLKFENVSPQQLAIDRPSLKFLSFLKKHFALKNSLPQLNKFVVFDLFFRDLSAVGYVPARRRFAASAPVLGRPTSGITFDTRPASSVRLRSCVGNQPFPHLQHKHPLQTFNPLQPSDRGECEGSKLLIDTRCPSRSSAHKEAHRPEVPTGFGGDHSSIKNRSEPQSMISAYSRHSYRGSQNTNRMKVASPQPFRPAATEVPRHTLKSNDERSLHKDTGYKHQQSCSDNLPTKNAENASDCVNGSASRGSVTRTGMDLRSGSYTIHSMYDQRGNARMPLLGTSWNVLGVPSGTQYRNVGPYGNIRKSNFQR